MKGLVQILQEGVGRCSLQLKHPSVPLSLQLNSFLELWAPWGAEGSRCRARLGETSHAGLTPNLQCSLSMFGAALHFQCHQDPSLSLGLNY